MLRALRAGFGGASGFLGFGRVWGGGGGGWRVGGGGAGGGVGRRGGGIRLLNAGLPSPPGRGRFGFT